MLRLLHAKAVGSHCARITVATAQRVTTRQHTSIARCSVGASGSSSSYDIRSNNNNSQNNSNLHSKDDSHIHCNSHRAIMPSSLYTSHRTFLDHLKPKRPIGGVVPDAIADQMDKESLGAELSVIETVDTIIAERKPRQLGRDLFSVIALKGKQYKVTQGDVIIIDNMEADVGAEVRLEKVLMFGSKEFTAVGAPLLPREACYVKATVVEKTRNRREIVFKYKKRKRYRKKTHFRHIKVMLRIDHILLNAGVLEGTDGISTEPERRDGKVPQNEPAFDHLKLSMAWQTPNRQDKVTLERLRDNRLDLDDKE